MAKKSTFIPSTCPADEQPTSESIQAMLDLAIDGHAFLGHLYNLPASDIEKIDMQRVQAKLLSFAAKSYALDFHKKMTIIAAALDVPPSQVLAFARKNVAVMGSRPESVIDFFERSVPLFEEHSITRALAIKILLGQNRYGSNVEYIKANLEWLNSLVVRGVVKPLSTPIFIATYYSAAHTSAETKAELEAYAMLQKECYGHAPRSLSRIGKKAREIMSARLKNTIALRAKRAKNPKAFKASSARSSSKPSNSISPWCLIEQPNEEFLLVAPSSEAQPNVAPVRITKNNGRLLRFMLTRGGLSNGHAAEAAAIVGMATDKAFAFTAARMVSVVRELEKAATDRPKLLQGRFANGDLAIRPGMLKYEKIDTPAA